MMPTLNPSTGTNPNIEQHSAVSYSSAVSLIEQIQLRDDAAWRKANNHEALHPECTTSILSHGHKTERAAVLIHGLTNCPRQYSAIAQNLFEQGYNVLTPRLPEHGHADRMTRALAQLSTAHMFSVVDKAVDAAQGLGEKVTVVGFSLGGVLASWLTQRRADIDKSVIISPALRTAVIPPWASNTIANFFAIWPNRFVWWDPKKKLEVEGTDHAYPRFSTRSLAHMLKSGSLVLKMAQETRPAAQSIQVIINPADSAVDADAINELVALWRSHDKQVDVFEFDPDWALIHDIIDPNQPQQQTARVYPILLDLITK